MKTLFTKKPWLPVVLSSALILPFQVKAQQNNPVVCISGSAKAEVESGNIKTMLLNSGDMFWDLDDLKFEVPKGSGKHSVFAGGIWFGGIDQGTGTLNAAVQTYRQGNPSDAGFWPGPLDHNGLIADQTCANFDFIAKAHASVINTFRNYAATTGLPLDETQIPDEIKQWPGRGNPFRPNISNSGAGQLAPFYDADGDGVYDPRQGDYPEILGDQAVYTIMNDAGGIKEPVSPVIGLEVHVMMFGFDNPADEDINNTMFARYTLINRGSKTLTNSYFGKWVDFDLGYWEDDYLGADSTRNMFYAYNGDNDDEGPTGYGQNPPAQGVVFLNEPLTNFTVYNNDFSTMGNPSVDTDYYNYMRSKWKNGNPITYGGSGQNGTTNANYMFSGNPETGTGWTELAAGNLPGDRRGVGAHGPFTFSPGEIKVFDVAYPWAQGTDNINSAASLKQATDNVKAFYASGMPVSRPAEQAIAKAAQVYPNPAGEAVEVILPGISTEKAIYTLRDITGRNVLQAQATVIAGQPQKLDLQQLPKGLYLLQVQQGNSSYSSKIVKQ